MIRRFARFAIALFAATCVLALAAMPAQADKRVALLIGNGAYAKTARLVNPPNDVALMKKALTDAGFDIVDARTDLDRAGMIKALQTFEEAVQGADIGVIFYSGHGMELNGQNYLIPVDAQLGSDRVVGDEAVSLERVLDALDGATHLKLAILDACRDNPFAASMKRSVTRGAPVRGLAKVDPVGLKNVLIAYAAAPGQTALDGEGANSPFTAALAKYLVMPGLDVQLALRKVRDDVGNATNQQQLPYQTGSLGGETLTLSKSKPPTEIAPPHADVVKAVDPDAAARADFALAMQVGSAEMWDAFKQKYPNFYPSVVEAERKKLAAPDTQKQAALHSSPPTDNAKSAPVTECDRLAARPLDPEGPASAPGVDFAQIDAERAIPACRSALSQYPAERRFMFALGRAYQSGKQFEEAARLYKQAADAGNTFAMNNLGSLYREGRGVAKDEAEGLRLIRKAADAGNSFAMNNLAAMYRDGRGVPQNLPESLRLYRKSAEAANPNGLYELALLYEHGRGVEKDDAAALRYFRQAVDAGSRRAMFNLGFKYEYGRGVAKDEAEAARLYRRGAEAGNIHSMNALAKMYATGRGVTKDTAEAMRLYRKAAEAGNINAMNSLAAFYANGQGVPRDPAQAKLWYGKAAEQGDLYAARALKALR